MRNKAIFEVQDALDWELKQGETLRQALFDAAEEELNIKDQEGELEVIFLDHDLIRVAFHDSALRVNIQVAGQNGEQETLRKAAITEGTNSVLVEFAGYNNCSTCDEINIGKGERAVVMFEVWEDELRLIVFGDINREDPTHIIPLENAKVTNRKLEKQ